MDANNHVGAPPDGTHPASKNPNGRVCFLPVKVDALTSFFRTNIGQQLLVDISAFSLKKSIPIEIFPTAQNCGDYFFCSVTSFPPIISINVEGGPPTKIWRWLNTPNPWRMRSGEHCRKHPVCSCSVFPFFPFRFRFVFVLTEDRGSAV